MFPCTRIRTRIRFVVHDRRVSMYAFSYTFRRTAKYVNCCQVGLHQQGQWNRTSPKLRPHYWIPPPPHHFTHTTVVPIDTPHDWEISYTICMRKRIRNTYMETLLLFAAVPIVVVSVYMRSYTRTWKRIFTAIKPGAHSSNTLPVTSW